MNLPILSILIFLPLVGVFFLVFTRGDEHFIRKTSINVSLITSLLTLLISIFIWFNFDKTTAEFQFVEEKKWIRDFINYKVGIDGVSLVFIILTSIIVPICIISTSNSVSVRIREFLISILLMETLMLGVFCSLDLFIFFLFFEAGLIPMFLIIGIWGGDRRVYSAFKFFLYTLFGSVFMLIAIIFIY